MIIEKLVREPIDVEIEGISLLTVEEYRKNKKSIPILEDSDCWWLRTESKPGKVYCVDYDGRTVSECTSPRNVDVRPVLRLGKVDLKPGDKVVIADYTWTVLKSGIALCDESIMQMAFREDWKADDANDYEKSDIKKELDIWAKENGII